MRLRYFGIFLFLLLGGAPVLSSAFELQPLDTRNLSPLALGVGLPSLGSAQVLLPDSGRAQATLDILSNYMARDQGAERLRLDGETYRFAVSGAYGVTPGLELGIELPLVSHQAGFLDDFIKGWHELFGLPQSGRDEALDDQFEYRYTRTGRQGFYLDSAATGIGDLALRAAWQCWQDVEKQQSLALRASLKLPTGDADKLLGSGSTDLSLWLSGEQRMMTSAGALLLYGGGGLLYSGDGRLLPDQRRDFVGLVSLGCGLQPWPRLGLQLQFDGHSALYTESHLRALDRFTGQLAIGGSLALGEKTALELAVVEDVIVETAADVAFHFSLRHQF